MSDDIYRKPLEDVLKHYEVDPKNGLSESDASSRLDEYGKNKIEDQENRSIWEILWDNLNNIIVYLLVFAALLSIFMGDWIEAVAIAIAVLIAVLTGFFAEYSAQQSAEALQDLVNTKVRVLRDGSEEEINAEDLVPGDIMQLNEGDAISADGRLIDSNNFAVMEAALTGESEAVEKDHEVEIEEEEALGDQVNMVFSGTSVTRGSAKAIVTATGMDTEVGHISSMLDDDDGAESPLDKEINQLGKTLIIVAFAAALLVFIIGLFNDQEWTEMLHIAIILAVAAIPEALPAVEAITLSNGMNQMADHKALVKNLSSVETLGSTSIIASDKTGTLTENQMMVQKVILADSSEYTVEGEGYRPEGKISKDDETIDYDFSQDFKGDVESDHPDLLHFILSGFFASEAQLVENDETDKEENEDNEGQYSIEGDPTDAALTVLGHKIGLTQDALRENDFNHLENLPFDSERKFTADLFSVPYIEENYILIKGAPDVIFDLAQTEELEEWEDRNQYLAENGMRVIAQAQIKLSDEESQSVDDNLLEVIETKKDQVEILGLYGIIDPPRPDVADSIKETQEAGIVVKMITGDHPDTASHIAQEIGINNYDKTMTGQEIDAAVEDEDFIDQINETAVFARVSPENKRQLVDAWQDDGQIVAMTGDGVNDAPALSGADIGIAMGIRGTEVAKESANMILTDDRYGTIVDAVEIGRIIFENIKKYVSFLFTCNMVEITTIIFTILMTLPMPVQPLHILYLNLVIDVAPAISLAFEPAENDVMKKEPRDPENGLVNRSFLSRIIISGIILGISSFLMFYLEFSILGKDETYAQTVTFAFMAIAQLMHLLNVRKSNSFGLDKTLLDNKVMLGGVLASLILLAAAIYLPFMNNIMGTVPIQAMDWLYITGIAALATLVVYLVKRVAVHD